MERTHCIAKEGYTYKRIVDGFIMGNELYLGKFIDGTDDVIENYVEVVDETPKEERSKYRYHRSRETITEVTE